MRAKLVRLTVQPSRRDLGLLLFLFRWEIIRYLRCRVVGVPRDRMGPMRVTVVHAYRVNLFFIALDATGCTNVVSKDPGFAALSTTKHVVGEATREY